ncbi:MAG: CehA/McbA family metallohydrolase [Candidatus Aminicenantes bacterium]|nr:CehA/McbA family metallohydrolase [Candidatus Aminicenantes bacterium]
MKGFTKFSVGIFFLLFSICLQASEFQVTVIKSEEDIPEKFCPLGKKGDYLVSDGKYLALVGTTPRIRQSFYKYPIENTMGSIIGFLPGGRNLKSDLIIGSPYVKVQGEGRYLAYDSILPAERQSSDGSFAFLAKAVFKGNEGEKARIATTYCFVPESGRIDIASTIENTGNTDIHKLEYSLYFTDNQIYSFSPFSKEDHPDRFFRIFPKKGYYLGWIDRNPALGEYEPLPVNLAPGKTHEIRYILLVDVENSELLRKIYDILNIKAEKARIDFADFQGDLLEVIVRDSGSSEFFRSFIEGSAALEIRLPPGLYSVRANLFPTVCDSTLLVAEGKENLCTLHDLPKGKVRVKIENDGGGFEPGKVTFIGISQTKTPYFRPLNPIETGNYVEQFKNSCYPPREGLEKELPSGTYLVFASRGPEYTLDQKTVEITAGSLLELAFRINKVVDTGDFISVDPHLHTLNSDGSVTTAERVKSVIAEGVDVAVSTDHNFVTDFQPALEELGLEEYLIPMCGEEVSPIDKDTNYLPEFNRYPLKVRENEPNNGAIETGFTNQNLPLYEKSREKDPGSLIHVNHPNNDYFSFFKLDRESAASARAGFDAPFDVMEVLNGPCFPSKSDYVVVEDWLHLLNRGYFYPLVGSSDSHEIDRDEPGYSRTYVYYEGGKKEKPDERALIAAMKQGRSFASTGPVVEFRVNDKYTAGDSFTDKEGKAHITIKVQSAPWVSVDELRIIVNGERKNVALVRIPRAAVRMIHGEATVKLERDAYIVIEVIGKKSLFPVVQRVFEGCGPLPYAITNPVFIDVDGNGRFDPPWPKIKFIKELPHF